MNEEMKQQLVAAGLDWKVIPEGLTTTSGIEVPDKVALVREDTKKILGIHTGGYEIYQNDELLELLHRIGQSTGLKLHTGGSFHGGQRVWFQLKSSDLILPNDKVEGYISGFNSFDGRSGMGLGNTNITVSCQNTFYRGYREVATKMRHSASMRPKIDEILRKIDVLLVEEQSSFKEIQRLGEVRMTNEVKDLIARRLFEISVEERLDSNNLSTNLKNKLIRFNYDMGIEIAGKGDTLWGGFSGLTRYSSHSMKQGKDNSENKMFGKTGVIERNIYKELVEMAG